MNFSIQDNISLPTLYIKKSNKDATIPTKGSEDAAGYDLYSLESCIIKPQESRLIQTGISMLIPEGYYGRIAPRSGLSVKGIDVKAGVIDRDYTGEVKVLLHNFNKLGAGWINTIQITKGTRIAQLILTKYTSAVIEEVEELPNTERGTKGFGSTGK